ncbi:MAG: trypsin-like peptidase domain-containing protein [Patescibacteria group bacterium]|nr:trypsin-like peptidase domain-containing protein [Patescibacteria group bacterium]MDE1945525.1 trypsin-like peptidase domain-containing protein [Patescibacteria group bacterium]MDE2058007.1 trypsin-like peptidase domain-containing protein [Patescibacteria group bacterium]
MIDRFFALATRVPLRTAATIALVFALATLTAASYAEGRRIRALDTSVANLEGSLAALEAELGALSQKADTAASSTASLSADLAASSRAQTAALKSQGDALQRAVAATTPAVVSIVAYDAGGNQVAAGTGFFARSTGYIVTNRHVVEDATLSYQVITATGASKPAAVVWLSPSEDLAVIKVAGAGYPTIALGGSSALALGEQVFAVGNALGRFSNSVSVGVVSGLDRSITAIDQTTGRSEDLSNIIQTDAAINPGNSGGPLVDLAGEAVGIDVATVRGSQSIGFAIPASEVKAALAGLHI